jgi:hypothetical protein
MKSSEGRETEVPRGSERAGLLSDYDGIPCPRCAAALTEAVAFYDSLTRILVKCHSCARLFVVKWSDTAA